MTEGRGNVSPSTVAGHSMPGSRDAKHSSLASAACRKTGDPVDLFSILKPPTRPPDFILLWPLFQKSVIKSSACGQSGVSLVGVGVPTSPPNFTSLRPAINQKLAIRSTTREFRFDQRCALFELRFSIIPSNVNLLQATILKLLATGALRYLLVRASVNLKDLVPPDHQI